MSQSKFEVNVSLDKLPPAVVKVIPYTGSSQSVDVYQQYRAMAFSIKAINTDSTNSISISLDGQPTFTINAGTLVNLEGVQFTTIDITGTGTADIILKVITQARFKTNNLVEID